MAYDSTDAQGPTQLAQLIPSVWGERINDFLKRKLVMANFFTNRSDELMDGGDTLITPNIAQMTANTKVFGAGVTLNQRTEDSEDLEVDQWLEVSFQIEDKEAAQVKRSYTIMETYARNAAYTVARALETGIAAVGATFTNTVGTATTPVTDAEVRDAIATLDDNDVDIDECAFFLHPLVFWRQIQYVNKFSLAVNAPVQDPVSKAPEASLYGKPVYTTNNIEGSYEGWSNLFAHPDAIHWATSPLGVQSEGGMVGSSGVRVQSHYMAEYLATLTTADILFGTVKNRDEAGVVILSNDTEPSA
jgi:hypothetical protein